jgi:hypothetical protein
VEQAPGLPELLEKQEPIEDAEGVCRCYCQPRPEALYLAMNIEASDKDITINM